MDTPDGETKIAGFFDRLRPTLNALTLRGKGEGGSRLVEIAKFLALMKGMDLKEVKALVEANIRASQN